MGKLLHRILPFVTIIAVGALLYDGWIFYSRWRDARNTEHARQEKQARDAQKSVDMMGGARFQILDFYAASAVIHRGNATNLCFGVSSAKTVRIEPPVETLHPALSYCFQVAPRKDTEFTLIAESASGQKASRSIRIKVVP